MIRPGHVDFWCDYSAEIPLWGGGGGTLYANSVPISDGLHQRLRDYQDAWEQLDYDEQLTPEL